MKKNVWYILLIMVLFGSLFFLNRALRENTKSETGEYVIVTDMKYLTMQNDGGSHTSIYYEINGDTVIKLQDEYVGFVGYKYQGKVLYQTKTKDEVLEKLKTLLDNMISNGSEEPSGSFAPFTIKRNEEEVILFHEEKIQEIKELLKQIDQIGNENEKK